MELSVIIPCLNGAATIAGQLDALAAQVWSKPWELIIADNGSTDDTFAIVGRYRERIPNLRIVDASAKRGCSYARNIGVRAAASDRFVFCDVDDEVAPGWVAAMGNALLQHDFVASRTDVQRLNPPWINALWTDAADSPHALPVCLGFLPAASGCGFGLTRRLYDEVGPFDEALMRLDDLDYSFRAQLAGMKIHLVPDAVVYYRYRQTLAGTYRQCFKDGQSEVELLKKYARYGMRWRPWTQGVRSWIGLMLALARIRDKVGYGLWLKNLGVLAGRMAGSIEHRKLAL